MFFYFFCPFVQETMEWEEFFVLFMNNEGPSVNNLPEITLQNCEIIKTKIWVILSIISALIMNVICCALGHMLAVESERYRSEWILTLLLTSWGPLVNAWLHSLPGGASSKSPQVGFCLSLLWAAWLGPAWPRKPRRFSPGCHIGWWFQVPLCRKDLGGVVGSVGDSHDFGDRCMGAQTWWVTLPGLVSWGSMILNPGGFILMGAQPSPPGAQLLSHLGHVLTVCDIWHEEKGGGWCEPWVSASQSPRKPWTRPSCTKAEPPRDWTPRGPLDRLSQTFLPGAPNCSKDFMDFHWHNCWQLT